MRFVALVAVPLAAAAMAFSVRRAPTYDGAALAQVEPVGVADEDDRIAGQGGELPDAQSGA